MFFEKFDLLSSVSICYGGQIYDFYDLVFDLHIAKNKIAHAKFIIFLF